MCPCSEHFKYGKEAMEHGRGGGVNTCSDPPVKEVDLKVLEL